MLRELAQLPHDKLLSHLRQDDVFYILGEEFHDDVTSDPEDMYKLMNAQQTWAKQQVQTLIRARVGWFRDLADSLRRRCWERDVMVVMQEVSEILVAEGTTAQDDIWIEESSEEGDRQVVLAMHHLDLGGGSSLYRVRTCREKLKKKTFAIEVWNEQQATPNRAAKAAGIALSFRKFVDDKVEKYVQKLRAEATQHESVEPTNTEASETPQDASVVDSQSDAHGGSLEASGAPQDAPTAESDQREAAAFEDSEGEEGADVGDSHEVVVPNNEEPPQEAVVAAE